MSEHASVVKHAVGRYGREGVMRALTAILALCSLLVAWPASGVSAGECLATLVSPSPEYDGYFGVSVSAAGDVNNDGYSDVIIGACRERAGGFAVAGRAYVFSGATRSVLYPLSSPTPETNGFFGMSVSGAGDVNNDGYDDVVVGAYREDGGSTDAGRAYVFSGATGDVLYPLLSPTQAADGLFGGAVAGAGDVNNDGYDDVLVGASRFDPWFGPKGEGRAYMFSGATGETLYTLVSPNPTPGYFGNWLSGIGDVDGDGCDDVVVGAWYEDGDSLDAGKAYVFSGATGDEIYTLVSPNQQASGLFGAIVSGAGDVNNDGFPDVVVGSFDGPPDEAGRAYVFSGPTGALLLTLVSPNAEAGGWFAAVAGAGDVDSDDHDDVIVGAPEEDPGSSPDAAGRVYIFSGATGDTVCTFVSPDEEYAGYFGACVSSAGDWNKGGRPDVVVGAFLEDLGTLADGGRAYVFGWDPPNSAPDIATTTPSLLTLRGPFPNPSPGDEVRLSLQVLEGGPGPVRLNLYDVGGRCITTVLDGTAQGGENVNLAWSPTQRLSPGVYWWRLQAGGQSVQRAMVIAK